MERIGDILRRYKQPNVTYLLAAIVGLLIVLVWLEYQSNKIAIRNHNLEVIAAIMACGEDEDAKTEYCETAIGEFMLPELGLFTR